MAILIDIDCSGLIYVTISWRDSLTVDFLVFWLLQSSFSSAMFPEHPTDVGSMMQMYPFGAGLPKTQSVDLCLVSSVVFCDG